MADGPPLPGAWQVRSDPEPEVWALAPAQLRESELDLGVLDGEERRRLGRFTRREDRRQFLAAHMLLRRVLARRLRCAPEDVEYTREACPACGAKNGRPVLAAPAERMNFSISGSRGLVLVAVASSRVGVDIEAIPQGAVTIDVSRLMHPAERAATAAAAPDRRGRVFATLWTRKEAYLKAIGTGIVHGLSQEYLGPEDRAERPRGWSVIELAVGPDHLAAVALKG